MNSGFIILAKVNICPTFRLIQIFNVLTSSSFPRNSLIIETITTDSIDNTAPSAWIY